MKVLFLDIDGVLNSARTAVAFNGYPHKFTPDHLQMFDTVSVNLIRGLCAKGGVSVVVSSAWRYSHGWDEIGRALELPTMDQTPSLCGTRGDEIADWLRRHPEVEQYAIVDDDLTANPCKQVRRNKERPRKEAPEPETLIAFLEWARKRPGQAQILAGMAEFAALAGSRRIEFRELTWPQVGEVEARLIRGKQRDGNVVVEVVAISAALKSLFDRMRALAKDDRMGYVFPTKQGNAYTDSGFKGMWNKLVLAAMAEKAITKRFTFHDLRAYYVTQHKQQRGALPDLHANPGTTARIYDRTKMVKRSGL